MACFCANGISLGSCPDLAAARAFPGRFFPPSPAYRQLPASDARLWTSDRFGKPIRFARVRMAEP